MKDAKTSVLAFLRTCGPKPHSFPSARGRAACCPQSVNVMCVIRLIKMDRCFSTLSAAGASLLVTPARINRILLCQARVHSYEISLYNFFQKTLALHNLLWISTKRLVEFERTLRIDLSCYNLFRKIQLDLKRYNIVLDINPSSVDDLKLWFGNSLINHLSLTEIDREKHIHTHTHTPTHTNTHTHIQSKVSFP